MSKLDAEDRVMIGKAFCAIAYWLQPMNPKMDQLSYDIGEILGVDLEEGEDDE